jgi:hypothetical protein
VPVTYDNGLLTWDSYAAPPQDDDYSFFYAPARPAPLMKENHGGFHVEFEARETVDFFRSGSWIALRRAAEGLEGSAHQLINGRPSLITGLLGIDTQHGNYTELHPAYALAIALTDDPQHEVWIFFARNWGSEGFCGSDNAHAVALAKNQFVLRIPWLSGASAVSLDEAMIDGSGGPGIGLPKEVIKTGDALYLIMPMPSVPSLLPPLERRPRIWGQFRLRWEGEGLLSRKRSIQQESRPADFTTAAVTDSEPERMFATRWAGVETISLAGTSHERDQRLGIPILLLQGDADSTLAAPRLPPRIYRLRDERKSDERAALTSALCRIYGDSIPNVHRTVCTRQK